MEKPIDPLHVQPLIDYEKCRDDIINKRNEAMAGCLWVDNAAEKETYTVQNDQFLLG